MLKIIKVLTPSFSEEQKILTKYRQKAVGKKELTRFKLAKKLFAEWREKKTGIFLPAVPERNDFWFLAQILFTGRYLNSNDKSYNFDLSQKTPIFIDASRDVNYKDGRIIHEVKNKSLFGLLLNSSGYNDLFINRDDLDKIILEFGDKVLDSVGLSNKELKLSIIPLDIYLRISSKYGFGKKNVNTFFDGYRLRTDEKKTALFGGNVNFGGVGFVDSIWMDSLNKSIIPRLIIIDKNYGL